MSFFKRLLGISENNQGEVLTRVSPTTWVSTSGEVLNQVDDHMAVSPSGTVYRRVGSTVVGSDGSLFYGQDESTSQDGYRSSSESAFHKPRGMFDDDSW